MAVVNLDEPDVGTGNAWLEMGFRPFFLGAGLFAVLAILSWMGVYVFHIPLYRGPVSPFFWHGHEMLFGYAAAVIAGFLLTAVKNWTGIQTIEGYPLLALFGAWLAGRVLFLAGDLVPLWLTAIVDCGFLGALVVVLAVPVLRVRRWKDLGLLSKILLLMFCNLVFFLGVDGVLPDGQRLGLYAALYVILALLFTMARRVIPFFIEKGVGYPLVLKNPKIIDIGSLVLFLVFAIVDLIGTLPRVTAWLAVVLFVIHLLRLVYWYTHGIWRRPLLWMLYLAYCWLVLAFALKAATLFLGISPYLSLHAFAYGGIGMMTLGMMSRVTLGHTGRSVFAPPPLQGMFLLLAVGALVRVMLPLLDGAHHLLWVAASQLLWIAAFAVFLYRYAAMLVSPGLRGPGA